MKTIVGQDILVDEILASVGRNASQLGDELVTGFLSIKGSCYDQKLMVVGRAVNGWTEGIIPEQLVDCSIRDSYAKAVINSVTGNGSCPMKWVADCWGSSGGYNTRKSAFWRVIHAVIGELGIADTAGNSWSSYLVWSNLYKVSPASGGNPGNELCDIQLDGCRSILDMELSVYGPKRLLLLTGLDWAKPFLKHICPDFKRISDSYVEAVGDFKNESGTEMKIVMAVHPQAKKQHKWVKEVMDYF